MQLLASIAAARALTKRKWLEGAAWLLAAYLPPLAASFPMAISAPRMLVAVALATTTAAVWRGSPRWAPAAALAGMLAIPMLAGVVNYPRLHTPALAELSGWAQRSTPKDAVFLFPDIGRGLEPGVFRSEALRAVYVDWKGGGQVNYLRDFAGEWWTRWQAVMQGFHESDLARYKALGIRYIVLRKARLAGAPLFQNAEWAVYDVLAPHVTVDPTG
jgi:uncharacterized protein DUF6798